MIDLDQMQFVGNGLHRPECVLARVDGTLHLADWRGGVTLLAATGDIVTVLANGDFRPRPNGIAILPDGGWLLTHLGDTEGGVFRLTPDGELTPFLTRVDGIDMPPTNYVHVDGQSRIWVTVSTRLKPRDLGYRSRCSDGFIVLVDDAGARIVADGLGYTNECLVHPETGQLYVNETFARRLTRFDVTVGGDLVRKTIITEFGEGEYPDGLTFDAEHGVWITSIVSNRVIRVARDGSREIIVEDSDPDHIAWTEAAYLADQLGRQHLDKAAGKKLKNISSLAFGGPNLKTVYLGCLLGDSIATFQSDQAGLAPYHWHL